MATQHSQTAEILLPLGYLGSSGFTAEAGVVSDLE